MNEFHPTEPGNTPLKLHLDQAEQVLGIARGATRRGWATPALVEYLAETAATFADLISEAWFADLGRAEELYTQLKAEYLQLYRLAQAQAA